MKVKLVSYSQPTEEFRQQNIDDALDLVAYCARVSNPANQFNTDTSEKLIKYFSTFVFCNNFYISQRRLCSVEK